MRWRAMLSKRLCAHTDRNTKLELANQTPMVNASGRPIRTLLFSTLYPSSVRPGHGIFVETRLRELLKTGQVEAKVVAPVPWFFSTHARYGEYARMAATPVREQWNNMEVCHPRYLLPPRIGMNLAPFVLAMGAIPAISRMRDDGFDFDLIDAHYYYPDGVAASLVARYFKKPFIVTARGSDINLIADLALPRRLIRWAAESAYASVGVSVALTDAMRNLGLNSSKLLTMRNGIDLERFRAIPKLEARHKLQWPEGPMLLSVGNLVKNKGHHFAIEALKYLPDFRLVIVGEGPERLALEALACEMGLESMVVFAGRIEQEKLHVFYSAADILVLPSSREGWPNVLLESMACGTPVVASNVGGVAEVVQSPQVGRLLDSISSSELAKSVQALWQSYPATEDVRSYAAQYSWQSTSEAQVRLFHDAATSTMS